MKKLLPLMAVTAMLFIASCGTTPTKEEVKTPESKPANADQAAQSFEIDTEKSVINWEGKILGIKKHTGTLKLKNGSIQTKGGKITSGGLTVDMTSMATTDENYDADHTSEGLIGHLSTGDFFEVEKYPVASVIFSGGNAGTLAVKSATHKENFTDYKMSEKNGVTTFSAKLSFDRQNYGVTFTGAKDTPVNDMIDLEIMLVAK